MAARKKKPKSGPNGGADVVDLAKGVKDLVLPGVTITTLRGEEFRIVPWGLAVADEVVTKIEDFGQAFATAGGDVHEVTRQALKECIAITAVTIGLTVEEMKADLDDGHPRIFLEDVFQLILAIVTTCLVREDGRGVLKPYGDLALLGGKFAQAMANRVG